MNEYLQNANRLLAYLRISTADVQTLERQRYLLGEFLEKNNIDRSKLRIYEEKKSGSLRNREILNNLLTDVQENDVLIVTSTDRLARDLLHLLDIAEELKNKKAYLFIMDHPELSTNSVHGMLLYQILGALASFERNLTLQRQREGIEAARKAGKFLGRQPSLDADQVLRASDMMQKFETNVSSVCKMLKITPDGLRKYMARNGQLTELGLKVVRTKYKKYTQPILPDIPCRRFKPKKS